MKNTIKRILERTGLLKPIYNFKEFLDYNESKETQKKRLSFYRNFISENDLVFDVGANVGNRTRIFVKLGARVIAIEPQLKQAKHLQKKFNKNIIVLNKGLGAEKSVEFMYISNRSTLSTFSKDFINKVKDSRFSGYRWNKKVLTEITTLDSLIDEFGLPKFCKVDVEGYEFFVLKGLSKPIPLISLEYNVPDLSDVLKKCINKLDTLNKNYLFNYSVGESSLIEMEIWKPYDEFIKIIESSSFLETQFGDIYAKIK
jgi:FkbM family methyltransferase